MNVQKYLVPISGLFLSILSLVLIHFGFPMYVLLFANIVFFIILLIDHDKYDPEKHGGLLSLSLLFYGFLMLPAILLNLTFQLLGDGDYRHSILCILFSIALSLFILHFPQSYNDSSTHDSLTTNKPASSAASISMPDPSQPDLGYDIAWEDVDSSMFQAVGYDSSHSVLGVLFLDSGKRYYYVGFSPEEYEAFVSADSLGSYYNNQIKASYYSFREDGSPTGASPK